MADPKLAIVIPTRNEVGNAPSLVSELFSLGLEPSVFVMDDASTDGTVESLERLAVEHDGLHVVRRSGPRGYGRACVEGLLCALRGGAELVLQMDGDGSHDPRYVPSMIEASREADLVLGSRYVHGISVVNWSLKRLLLSTAANRYIRLFTGLKVRDCTTGFRLWRRALLENLVLEDVRSDGYSFLVETLFRARRAGAKVVEVPIIFVERRAGESKLSLRVFLESALLPWRLLAQRLVGRLH